MVIDCPGCQMSVEMGNPAPGRYRASCLSCQEAFSVVIPKNPAGRVKIIASRQPSRALQANRRAVVTESEEPTGLIIDCPLCREPVDLGNPDVGKYHALCPECNRSFRVVVPEDPTAPIRILQPAALGGLPSRRALLPGADYDVATSPTRRAIEVGDGSVEKTKVTPRGSSTEADRHDDPGDESEIGMESPDDFSIGTDDEDQMPLPGEAGEVPNKLGGYEVVRLLGKGGMGSVLLGRQVSLDRRVALKVMNPKIARDPSFVARFAREAYAAAQLTHHNVVQIYDIGEDRGQPFFSMEFVKGESLSSLVQKRGRLSPEVAVGFILQAARGLRQGHVQGMVHRDVKPANLLVNEDGIVKVADLGLVKLPGGGEPATVGAGASSEDGSRSAELTEAGTTVGTPAFMAPEQAVNSAAVDARADVYSLGCTLYVLVTGKPPFEGKTAPEVMSKHVHEPVVPPSAIVKRVPPALSSILLRMLAKEPSERYQSMDEVIEALERFLGQDRTGAFSPREEQADQLEGFVNQFNSGSSDHQKQLYLVGFLLLCLAAVVGGALSGKPIMAVGALALGVMAPLTYFIARGISQGGVVFGRFVLLVQGMRWLDWLMLVGGTALFLASLYLFGVLWVWVGVTLVSLGLAIVLVNLADLPQARAQREPLDGARALFKKLRLHGLGEEQLRQFVCKYSGPDWEPFFEALFGYEAKLAARAYRKGETGEVTRKADTWREPLVAWADNRLEARRLSREREFLRKTEAKSLAAEGVSKPEVEERAAAMALALVDQAAEAKKARKAGHDVDLRGMVDAARSRRPLPGYNLAGKKLRSLWLRTFLDEWFGRRLRFFLGAAMLAVGLFWTYENQLLTAENPVAAEFQKGDVMTGLTLLSESPTPPPPHQLQIPGLPAQYQGLLNTYRFPLVGLSLLISAAFFFGWRASIPAVIGAVIGVAGPTIGIPDAKPYASAEMVSLMGGAGIILIIGWLTRR